MENETIAIQALYDLGHSTQNIQILAKRSKNAINTALRKRIDNPLRAVSVSETKKTIQDSFNTHAKTELERIFNLLTSNITEEKVQKAPLNILMPAVGIVIDKLKLLSSNQSQLQNNQLINLVVNIIL